MKFELLIFGLTAFFIANTYHDNKYIEKMKTWKKYYQMIGIGFVGISTYVFLKKYPNQSSTLFSHANGMIKYLPIDRNTTHFLAPIIDMVRPPFSNHEQRLLNSGYGAGANGMGMGANANGMGMGANGMGANANANGMGVGVGSGNVKATKRSVSETKKKYVAAQQGWKCDGCKEQLPAWFEVDHKVRLDSGGSNHIDNLVAYCRNCHGKKTAFENF
jgi:hypothetical protein